MLGDIQILKSLADLAANPPGVATNFFAAAVETPKMATRLTIQVALTIPGRLSYSVNGSAAIWLNGGALLTAACAYNFMIATRPGQTYNFQLDSAAALMDFALDAAFSGS